MIFRNLIIRGAAIANDWHYLWFTKGLSTQVLLLEDVKPMFYAKDRVLTIPGDRRTAALGIADAWKYPKDKYDISIDWEGQQILPIGAKSLSTLVVTVKDDVGADVTGTLLVSSGTSGLISWAQIQAGTKNKTYTVILKQTFNNGKVLEKYVALLIKDPRVNGLPNLYKYPNDKYDVPVQWSGSFPRGAASLGELTVSAYDASDIDETNDYLSGSRTLGTFSIGFLSGGVASAIRLIEFAQTFDNGRVFHDYAFLTVKTPPA